MKCDFMLFALSLGFAQTNFNGFHLPIRPVAAQCHMLELSTIMASDVEDTRFRGSFGRFHNRVEFIFLAATLRAMLLLRR